jgi:excisionase family DNA binding protein
MSSSLDTRYLKAADVAARLAMDVSTVYKMMDRGDLPSVMIGGKSKRVPAGALAAYLDARTTGGRAKPVYVKDDNGIVADPIASLDDQVRAFEEQTGCSPAEFAERWRSSDIPDTPENAQLAIQGLALREALAATASHADAHPAGA